MVSAQGRYPALLLIYCLYYISPPQYYTGWTLAAKAMSYLLRRIAAAYITLKKNLHLLISRYAAERSQQYYTLTKWPQCDFHLRQHNEIDSNDAYIA